MMIISSLYFHYPIFFLFLSQAKPWSMSELEKTNNKNPNIPERKVIKNKNQYHKTVYKIKHNKINHPLKRRW